MKYHPIANVWPLMTEQEIEDLAEDIRRNGQLCPIWTYEGMILDGRNRWAACLLANVKPIVREYDGDQPTAFAVALNDKRRHMNKAALAAVAAALEPFSLTQGGPVHDGVSGLQNRAGIHRRGVGKKGL